MFFYHKTKNFIRHLLDKHFLDSSASLCRTFAWTFYLLLSSEITSTPISLFQSSAAHYSASDDCLWSILWLRAEWKKILTVCCLLGTKPVGQCDTKHSWVLWKITVRADTERSVCVCDRRKHKLPFIWIGGRSVSNSPISKLRDVWQT